MQALSLYYDTEESKEGGRAYRDRIKVHNDASAARYRNRTMATQTERAAFNWDDPFMLDEQLTEDERMIRDTARAYAQDKLLPRVTKAYLERRSTATSSTKWASSA
jgi:hypothetical protein